MADLSGLNVVAKANEGTVLELMNPFNLSETLTDIGEEYQLSVDKIKSNDKLSDEQKTKEIDKLAKPKPFYLRLLGSDSDTYRGAIKRRFENSQSSKNKNKKIDLDDAQLKAAELIARCTTECFLIEDGKAVECTQSEMVRLYMKYPWLREQAEAQIGDRSALMTS